MSDRVQRRSSFSAGPCFGEAVASIREWLDGAPCRELPGPDAWQAPVLPALASEPRFAAPRTEPVVITHWPEALGALEPRLAELAPLVASDVPVLLDVRHAMAPSAVRTAFEGRVSSLDPMPALGDQELAFLIPRLVRALHAAGFVVEDLQRIPARDGALAPATIEAVLRAGFAPLRHLYEAPPERIWVKARRAAACAGSVLVATSDRSESTGAVARTREALAFLPASFEIVVGPAEAREATSWNRALTASRGDLVWLLRAGDTPSEATFAALAGRALGNPVLPADPDLASRHGIAGLLLERALLCDVGPLPEDVPCDVIAGEEWAMRASAAGRAIETIVAPVAWRGPGPAAGDRASELASSLLERWSIVTSLENPGDPRAHPVAAAPWQVEGREPRISLCMIARNEERFLDACLERVRDVVDEIVLVDTGSSDATIDIARSFGATVIETEWDDDFARPRNLGLAQATGDWILVLDPDELVEEASLPLIRELARNERSCGYHMRFRNEHEGGRTPGVTMVRLFRNLDGLEYRYAIHEQVTMSLTAAAEPLGLAIHPSEITVIHFGYAADVMQSRNKRERNLRIFAKQLERDPEDVYCLYKYADFLRLFGDERELRVAIDAFRRALELIGRKHPSKYPEMPFAAEVAALLALELAKRGDVDEADRIARDALRRFIPTPNLHYIAAGIATTKGRFDEALAHYRRCIDYHGRVLVVPVQEGVTSWVAWTGMAQCWLGKGDVARARELLERAQAERPDWDVACLAMSALAIHEGALDRALAVLARYLDAHGESRAVREQGALLLERIGLSARAEQWRAASRKRTTATEPLVAAEVAGAKGA